MKPEEKQWWKDKQTSDYNKARDSWHQQQMSRDKPAKGGCFVATAAFGDYNAPEVVYLSAFRDESLSRSVLGRGFIRAYYAVSPRFASVIEKSSFLRLAVRKLFLQPIIFLLRLIRY
ncbi:MAG TPA: CFI-box-CTERM domain-containing protein [Pyrinomonadaceae bacterium]|jgi:hypothetical protein